MPGLRDKSIVFEKNGTTPPNPTGNEVLMYSDVDGNVVIKTATGAAHTLAISGTFVDFSTVASLTGNLQGQITSQQSTLSQLTAISGAATSGSGISSAAVASLTGSLQTQITDHQNTLSLLTAISAAATSGSGISSAAVASLTGSLQTQITAIQTVDAGQQTALSQLTSVTGSFATNIIVASLTGSLQNQITAIGVVDAAQQATLSQLTGISGNYTNSSTLAALTGSLQNQVTAIQAVDAGQQITLSQLTSVTGTFASSAIVSAQQTTLSQLTSVTGSFVTTSAVASLTGSLQTQITANGNVIAGQQGTLSQITSVTGSFATNAAVVSLTGSLQTQVTAIQAVDASQQATLSVLTAISGVAISGNFVTTSYLAPLTASLQTQITAIQTVDAGQQTALSQLTSVTGSFLNAAYLAPITGSLQTQITAIQAVDVAQQGTLSQITSVTGSFATQAQVTAINLVDAGQQTALSQLTSVTGSFLNAAYLAPITGNLQTQIINNVAVDNSQQTTLSQLTSVTGNYTNTATVASLTGSLQTQITSVQAVDVAQQSTLAQITSVTGSFLNAAYLAPITGSLQTQITAIQAVDVGQQTALSQLTSVTGSFATTPAVASLTGNLQTQITAAVTVNNSQQATLAQLTSVTGSSISGNYVDLTTNQAISGTKTFAGSLFVTNSTPSLYLTDTDDAVDNRIMRVAYDNNVFVIQSRSDANANIASDYILTRDTAGANSHEWRLANSANNNLKFTGGTFTIRGVGSNQLAVVATDVTGSGNDIIQSWATQSGGGLQVRVDQMSASNPMWILNKNSGETLNFSSAGNYDGTTSTTIGSNGRWGFGGSAAFRQVGAFSVPVIQIEQIGQGASISVVRNSADGSGPAILFAKTRGIVQGAVDSISADDIIMRQQYVGADGTSITHTPQAEFRAYAQDTSGSGYLTWYTAKFGSLGENMRLNGDGQLGLSFIPLPGEGLIQLPNTGVDKSGGIRFGTNLFIYRSGSGELTIATGGSPTLVCTVNSDTSGTGYFYDKNGRLANLSDVQAISAYAAGGSVNQVAFYTAGSAGLSGSTTFTYAPSSTTAKIMGSIPRITLDETKGTTSFRTSSIYRDADILNFTSQDITGGNVRLDYRILYDANGATEHNWRLENDVARRLRFTGDGRIFIDGYDSSGLLTIANSSITGANVIQQNWTTSAGGGMQVRVDAMSSANPTWILNRNAGESLKVMEALTDVESWQFNASGNRLIHGGDVSNRSVGTYTQPALQIERSSTIGSISLVRNAVDGSGPAFILAATRGSANGAVDAVSAGDRLARFVFASADGNNLDNINAEFRAYAQDTSGSGYLSWYTSKLGAAVTEKMRIDADGGLRVFAGNITATGFMYDVNGRLANLSDVQSISGNFITSAAVRSLTGSLQTQITANGVVDAAQQTTLSQLTSVTGNFVDLTSGQVISGSKTFTNDLIVSNTNPALKFVDTDSGTDNKNVWITYDLNTFVIQSRTEAGASISNDYAIVKDSAGASSHTWKLRNNANNQTSFSNGTFAIRGVGTSQLTVTATDITGAGNDIVQSWNTQSGGGLQVRVDNLSAANPTWNFNRNSGENMSFTSAGDYVGPTSTHIIGNRWAIGGPNAQRAVGAFSGPFFQIEYTSAVAAMSVVRNSADTNGGGFVFGKTRGNTNGDTDSISANDMLGRIQFVGADGTTLNRTAQAEIRGYASDTSGSGQLRFYTASQGAIAETARLDENGVFSVGTTPFLNEGLIQLPNSGTDKSGGMRFGTNLFIYRSGSGELTIATAGSPTAVFTTNSDISGTGYVFDKNGRLANISDVQAVSGNYITSAAVRSLTGGLQTSITAIQAVDVAQQGTLSQITSVTGSFATQAQVTAINLVDAGQQTALSQLTSVTGSFATTAAVRSLTGGLQTSITALQVSDTAQQSVLSQLTSVTGTATNIRGRTDGLAPASGFIGEYLISTSNGISATISNGSIPVGTLDLTPGLWRLSGVAQADANGGVTGTSIINSWISTITGNSGGLTQGYEFISVPVVTTSSTLGYASIPSVVVNISANARYYMVASINYSGGKPKWFGNLSATRIG